MPRYNPPKWESSGHEMRGNSQKELFTGAAPAAKVIATTAALEALNRHHTEDQIQRGLGTRDAHVPPAAARAPRHGTHRRLVGCRIERSLRWLFGFHRRRISFPSLSAPAADRTIARKPAAQLRSIAPG